MEKSPLDVKHMLHIIVRSITMFRKISLYWFLLMFYYAVSNDRSSLNHVKCSIDLIIKLPFFVIIFFVLLPVNVI